MTALNNLLFKVSLLDNMSGPAKGMMNTMNTVTTKIQGGFNKIAYGGAGLAGAAYSLDNILQPAKEMQTALGEIKSLGVGQQVLDDLSKTAMDFSSQYGESATKFVQSSYAIQSAISGLAGNELAAFTNASSILAKGTKADMGVITDYVGTMYGVFKNSADAMGKSKWVEQLAGQTALAVNIFKTDGKGMSEAFSGLAGASSAPMAEQLAVLGQLQAVKHGSEAGTLYKTFLAGVGKSQKELGLNFTDANGKLLPMVDILTKITGKFGSLEKQSTRDMLTKALGGTEAMSLVDILSKDIGGLNNNIAEIGKQTGLQGATDMAKAMTMPWDRANESVNNLRIMLGNKMLVVMTPLYNKITEVSETLRRWTELFPNITRYVGYAVFAVTGIIAALSALSIVVGVGMMVSAGFGLAWSAVGLILTPLAPLLTALRMAWVVMKMEMLAGTGVFAALKIGLAAFATQLWTNISAIWAWNVALFSNPITWIVLGIGALIGVIAAAVIYWDTWTQAVIDWSSAWLESTGVFAWVDSVIALFERIPQWWNNFKGWIGSVDPFYLLGQGIGLLIVGFESIPQWWANFAGWIGTLNPFALVSAGIGLIVAGFEAIPQWWASFSGWIGTLNPFALVGTGIDLIVVGFESIKIWWSEFKNWLSALNPFAGISSAVDSLMRGIQSVTGSKMPSATATQPPALDNISAPLALAGPQTAAPSLAVMSTQPQWLQHPAPGLLTDGFTPTQSTTQPLAAMDTQPKWLQQPPVGTLTDGFAPPKPVAAPAALSQSQTSNVPKGGIMSQINNADNSKSVSVGGITVNNYGQPVTGQRLADEIAMAAG
ncbi:MAG: phage tail tape measure protein [Methylobacter sp.]